MTLAELLEQCGVDTDEWTCIPDEMGYTLSFLQEDGGLANITAKVDEITETIIFDYES